MAVTIQQVNCEKRKEEISEARSHLELASEPRNPADARLFGATPSILPTQ